MQLGGREDFKGDVQVTLLRDDALAIMTSAQLHLAAAASFIELGAQLRFSHQLLQEYFVALGLQTRLAAATLDADKLWPRAHWWARSGTSLYESTAVAAG